MYVFDTKLRMCERERKRKREESINRRLRETNSLFYIIYDRRTRAGIRIGKRIIFRKIHENPFSGP